MLRRTVFSGLTLILAAKVNNVFAFSGDKLVGTYINQKVIGRDHLHEGKVYRELVFLKQRPTSYLVDAYQSYYGRPEEKPWDDTPFAGKPVDHIIMTSMQKDGKPSRVLRIDDELPEFQKNTHYAFDGQYWMYWPSKEPSFTPPTYPNYKMQP